MENKKCDFSSTPENPRLNKHAHKRLGWQTFDISWIQNGAWKMSGKKRPFHIFLGDFAPRNFCFISFDVFAYNDAKIFAGSRAGWSLKSTASGFIYVIFYRRLSIFFFYDFSFSRVVYSNCRRSDVNEGFDDSEW